MKNTKKYIYGDMDAYLNCILVSAGLRPAFLYQWVDHGDFGDADDPRAENTEKALCAIRDEFPDLKEMLIDQGVLFSSTPPSFTRKTVTTAKLGKILDFPAKFVYPAKYSYSVNVQLNDGTVANLYAFVSSTNKHMKDIRARVGKYIRFFSNDPRTKELVKSVSGEMENEMSITECETVLKNLRGNKNRAAEVDKMTAEDKHVIYQNVFNHIWNDTNLTLETIEKRYLNGEEFDLTNTDHLDKVLKLLNDSRTVRRWSLGGANFDVHNGIISVIILFFFIVFSVFIYINSFSETPLLSDYL